MSNFKYQNSNRIPLAAALVVAWFELTLVGAVGAQEIELRLSLHKDWGFSLGSQIQGLFTLSAERAQDITSIRFELDGDEIATETQPPFKRQINTDKYPPGRHTFSATAQTSDGHTFKSNTIAVEFVSSEAGWQATQRIMIPLMVVVGIVIVLSTAGQLALSGRDQRHTEPGTPRRYGILGGTICPKCGRPFALSFYSPNLVTRKLERCPHCGKWSLVSRASREALAVAEAAEAEASKPTIHEPNPEEKLRQQIEESKYQ